MSAPPITSPNATAPPVAVPRRRTGATRERGRVAAGVAAWAVGLLFVGPILWMLLTSFHHETDAATNPPSLFAPLSLDGYRTFFGLAGGPTRGPR